MTINKFQGKTEEEALEKAKNEMGQGLVIMNVKVVKPKGLFGFLKTPYYEVTAAMEDREQVVSSTVNGTHRSTDLAADEQISLPKPEAAKAVGVRQIVPPAEPISEAARAVDDILSAHATKQRQSATVKTASAADTDLIEERLENLQQFLEKKLTDDAASRESGKEPDPVIADHENQGESVRIFRMLYQTLLENEVDEKYANQIISDFENKTKKETSLDNILSGIYQKIVLKLGQQKIISTDGDSTRFVFFIGPTGVGKTTTIAKIASAFKLQQKVKVGLITADTYRVAAVEQLRTYANILGIPLKVVYSIDEMKEAQEYFKGYDVVLIDTAGRSHKNEQQKEDIRHLLDTVPEEEKDVFLVLSATTKYRDLIKITESYEEITNYGLIFTKLDETNCVGNIYNIKMKTDAPLSYSTYGQNGPDDITQINPQNIAKQMLGGCD